MTLDRTAEKSSSAEDSVLIDETTVAALAADVGSAQLAPVLAAFVAELARRAPILQAALDAADLPAVARETHSIKGSALTFGAVALGGAARRANDASRAGDATAAFLGARQVLSLMPPTQAAVDRLIAREAEAQPR